MKSTSTRCALLDELRGLDLISMMLYHGMWDLVYLFGVRAPWYGSWQGELWQQSICWVFILLSGFCLPLGRHPVKRGAVVFGCGALVTAVTLIFMPADAVWFGVLTLLGSAMIITGLLEKWMEKVPPVVGLAGSMFLFYFTRYAADGYLQLGHWLITLPGFLYANYFTAYLGFYPFGFFSTDYFPLTPWLFLFWAGFLPASSGRANSTESPSAASFGLPAAGVAGAKLADAISAPPAGDLRRADDGVPVAAPGWRSALKNSAKGS